MKTIEIQHSNGNTTTYKISENNTAFHIDTPEKVCNILDSAILSKRRLKIYYGDKDTGTDWNECYDIIGRIGRSYGGTIKIPLLILTSRSYGGGAILDNCIVKIKDAKSGEVIYQHPKYNNAKFEILKADLPEYTSAIYRNGKLYSRHKTERSAKLLFNKIAL